MTPLTLPFPCVFSINVDAEFVAVTWHPGRIYDVAAHQWLTGRHDASGGGLMAVQMPDLDGVISRVQVDGFVTDSAADAVLWASELAQGGKGEMRRALEIHHEVVVAALNHLRGGKG